MRNVVKGTIAAALWIALHATSAWAALGDCSQPITNGANPTASDCLFILNAAVGNAECDPECICAPKGTLPTTASDALICLNRAVGAPVNLNCPCPITTTSTTTLTTATTSTTTIPVIGANIVIVNKDGASEGFNDPAARAPVGGNPGTTLGQQRLNVFNYAAQLLSQLLVSDVDILVDANFNTLPCSTSGAVLGQAGPQLILRDFPGAPLDNTWYPIALANALGGADICPTVQGSCSPTIANCFCVGSDIGAEFNSAIGTTCAFPTVWYYGLDGNPPNNTVDLVTVVLHELGHGLGFLTTVNLTNGTMPDGADDAYSNHLEDHSLGFNYPDMSDGQRAAANKDTGDLHWNGPSVVAGSAFLTTGRHASGHVRMYAPSPVQQGSSVSHWDTVLVPNQLMEPAYTGPLHDVGLMGELFQDIGWQVLP